MDTQMINMVFATFNIAGLAKQEKRSSVDKFLYTRGIKVCALQETNLTSLPVWCKYGLFLGLPSSSQHAGLALWINRNANVQVKKMQPIVPDRIASFELVIDATLYYTLFNIHLPHRDAEVRQALQEWINFIRDSGIEMPCTYTNDSAIVHSDFQEIIQPGISGSKSNTANCDVGGDNNNKIHKNYSLSGPSTSMDENFIFNINNDNDNKKSTTNKHNFLVLGDFNMSLDRPADYTKGWRKVGPRRLMEDICKALHVQHVPMQMEQNKVQTTRGDGIIDFICIPKSWRLRIKSFLITHNDFSDHSLLQVDIRCGEDNFIKPPYWRFKNQLLCDEIFIKKMTSYLNKKLQDIPCNQAIHPWWEHIKTQVLKMAKDRWMCIIKNPQSPKGTGDATRLFSHPVQKIYYLWDKKNNILSDQEEIMESMASYYEGLYTSAHFKEVPHGMNLGINQITGDQAQELGQNITGQELEIALNSLNLNKAPGIDGMTVECYIKFWKWFQPMMTVWAEQTIQLGKLTGFSSTGVITLIYKKDDPRNIGNWRPITLMTVDAKILSRALAMRMNGVLETLIPVSQNCIPGRTIHASLSMVRDVLTCAKLQNHPIYILSVDQAKAFDRINHLFLFKLLEIANFPPYMIQAIRSLYTGYSVVLKNVDKLSRPVRYCRGIRQGDPLSTALYALALAPALNLIQTILPYEGFLLSNGTRLLMTSYADDVTFFLESSTSVHSVIKAFSIIAEFSEAKLNLNKSVLAPFFTTTNNIQEIRSNINDIFVSPEKILVLGVVFTASLDIQQEQWDTKLHITRNKILEQTPILVSNTYFERSRWINTKIWPRWTYLLKVLQPSEKQLRQLEAVLVQAIWLGGKHWLGYPALTLSTDKGGLALVSPLHRVNAMRVMFISRTINEGVASPAFLMVESILGSYAEANLGLRIFHTIPESQPLHSLPSFYRAAVTAWTNLPIVYPCNSLKLLLEMPCFSSKLLMHQVPSMMLTSDQAKSYGVVTIKQFLLLQNRNTRRLVAIKEGIASSIAEWQKFSTNPETFSERENLTNDEVELVRAPKFIITYNQRTYSMNDWSNRLLYRHFMDSSNIILNEDVPIQTWKGLPRQQVSPTALNQFWRFLHHRVPTPSFYNNMGLIDEVVCTLCGEQGTDFDHQFCSCPALGEAIEALSQDIQELGLKFLRNQNELYPGPTQSAKLANLCIITFIYMVIVITRSVTNSDTVISKSKIKSIYFDFLAKHVVCVARSCPPSHKDKRFMWLILTHANLIAKWSGDKLLVRTSSGYKQFSEERKGI